MSADSENIPSSSTTLEEPVAKKIKLRKKSQPVNKNDSLRIRPPLVDISQSEAAIPSTSRDITRSQWLPKKCVRKFTLKKVSNKSAKQLGKGGKVALKQSDTNEKCTISEMDLCDCLKLKCQGCFGSCLKCGSPKCGPECKVNRPFFISKIKYENSNRVIRNPLPLKYLVKSED